MPYSVCTKQIRTNNNHQYLGNGGISGQLLTLLYLQEQGQLLIYSTVGAELCALKPTYAFLEAFWNSFHWPHET